MSGTTIKVIEKALDLLEHLELESEGLSLGKLAELTGENPNTLRGILNTLIKKGYVAQPQSRGHYQAVKRRATGEPTFNQAGMLALLDDLSFKLDGAMVYVSLVDGLRLTGAARLGHRGTFFSETGGQLDFSCFHALAQGKLVLAQLSEYELEHRFGMNPPQAFTGTTLTDMTELKKQLATVRQDNFAAAIDEFETGIASFAVGLKAANGTLAATVAVRVSSLAVDAKFMEYAGNILHECLEKLKKIIGV